MARNRLVAALSQALFITEASEKSSSLHTARFALEQGRDVMAVPGDITRPGSVGTNNLIEAGAIPVRDALTYCTYSLGLEAHQLAPQDITGGTRHEQRVLDLLLQGNRDGEKLPMLSRLTVSEFNQVLTMLELGGKIRALGGNQWAIF